MESVLLNILLLAVGLAVSFFVIRAAATSALRRGRREEFIERTAPENAEWLPAVQRRELRQHLRGASD